MFSVLRYLVVGFSTFGLDYLLNWLTIEVIGVNYLIAGYVVSPFVLAFNFYSHKLWTYQDIGSKESMIKGQVARYLVLVVFNMIANMSLMYVFYGVLKLPLFFCRVLCTGLSIAWSFPVQRFWVFPKR